MLTSADRQLVSVESEDTYGVDAIDPGPPSAYQAFRTVTINPVRNQIESPRLTWTASGEKSCGLNSHNDVSWEMPFTGKLGAAGTAASWDALLLASGFKKTVVPATSVSYKPNTINDMTDTPSATLWQYLRQLEESGAYLLKARGYRGNASIRLTVGEEAVISGTGLALYSGWPTSTVSNPTPPSTYAGASCMVVQRLVLTAGAIDYPLESMELNTNWTLSEVRTGELGGGTLSKVLLTRPTAGSRMGGSIRLVDGKTALQDLVTKWQAGTTVVATATLSNGVDTITLSAPSFQFGQPAPSAEGVMKFDVPYYLNRGTTGDDELTITLT